MNSKCEYIVRDSKFGFLYTIKLKIQILKPFRYMSGI